MYRHWQTNNKSSKRVCTCLNIVCTCLWIVKVVRNVINMYIPCLYMVYTCIYLTLYIPCLYVYMTCLEISDLVYTCLHILSNLHTCQWHAWQIALSMTCIYHVCTRFCQVVRIPDEWWYSLAGCATVIPWLVPGDTSANPAWGPIISYYFRWNNRK